MEREDILLKLKEILSGDEGLVLEEVISDMTEETSLIEDFVMDSLQILNFIVLIENKFNFVCSENELNLDMFDRVGDLIDFIIRKSGTDNN